MIQKLKLPPTKSTLIRLKKQVGFLYHGQELLEHKAEMLGRLIHEHLADYKQLSKTMQGQIKSTYYWLGIMQMRIDNHTLECATDEVHPAVDIKILPRRHLGVEYPSVTAERLGLNPVGLLGTDASFDETRLAMRDMAILLATLGQAEVTLSRLIDEHSKVRKRVNALKNNIIPSHEAMIKLIHDSLEESERESVFQIKLLRSQIEREQDTQST